MPTLIDIGNDMHALADLLEDEGGDITDHEETIDAWFDEIGSARDKKLDGYAALIRELEIRSDIRKGEARRLADRARLDSKKASYLKERLKHFFQAHELKRIETPRFRLTLARHGGKRPVALRVPAERLPEPFRKAKVRVKADTNALREFLEETGGTLRSEDGYILAELGERGSSIRIR